MARYYVALGSNLGNPSGWLRAALTKLAAQSRLVEVARFYLNPPWGVTDQGPFVNTAATLDDARDPEAMLELLLRIERDLGRVRLRRWGPRIIDLDLLCDASGTAVESPTLSLPHPGIRQRAFVLAPLLDLAPELRIGRDGLTVRRAWDALDAAARASVVALARGDAPRSSSPPRRR